MAMICSLFCVKNSLLRFNFLAAGLIGLAIISTDIPWLNILLAFSFCFHLWKSFERKNTLVIILSTLAIVLFIALFFAYLLLDVRLYWVVLAIILLAIVTIMPVDQPTHSKQVNEHGITESSSNYISSSPLASLPTRKAMFNHIFSVLKNQFKGGVVVLRLEGFEQVNQHIGRDFGDLLLAQSANRIKNAIEHDQVIQLSSEHKLAHLGGLNFAFICSLAKQNHIHEQLIQKIINATLKPFNVANCTVEIKVRASYVDCAHFNEFDDGLISAAFLALDSQERQQVVVYQPQMMIAQLEQQARIAELANIDFSSELELYFQPVICNNDGHIAFLELLLRWQHPKQGILSAHRFIDDIKIAGLGYPLAKFVMKRAAELACALKRENISVPLSINVFGPEMLNEEFVEYIDALLSEHQLFNGELVIECPLHIFTNLDDQGQAMVARLNSMGLKLCVDGLGDNPVLLAKLPGLAVEYVKISPALTADFSNQNNIRSLVSGMVDMHNQQHTKVIFEGVETAEQLKFVKSLNAYATQGYYFGHPLSSVGLMNWLKQWRLEQKNISI
ncbi:EAL domain-containing protein [Pseudoalteromonas sp. MMG010]|uniref:GGDEF domain-containing phosphodiesterase n=1 Tax=Pseudoalteromonas sp. MMG010 TaxID=2822685 RepID=UPI001B3A487A|nr:GGDEF domain-containing phosphodiesterase [Pseudoalteromonas sp. MMG010]MBQ4832610.1 EAL domain-containing protein [Pseudoalteromonas sp. MMG010]